MTLHLIAVTEVPKLASNHPRQILLPGVVFCILFMTFLLPGCDSAVWVRAKVISLDGKPVKDAVARFQNAAGLHAPASVSDDEGCLDYSCVVPAGRYKVPLLIQKAGYKAIVLQLPTLEENCVLVTLVSNESGEESSFRFVSVTELRQSDSATKIEWLNTLDLPEETLAEHWLPVDPSQWSWVSESKSKQVEDQLQSVDFLKVPVSQAAALIQATDTSFSPPPGLRVFVVRGVCFGSQPTFASVQVSASSNTIHVYQGTAQPELYFPGAMARPPIEKRPLLLALQRPPGKVLVNADYGGDRVLRWFRPSTGKWFPTSQRR